MNEQVKKFLMKASTDEALRAKLDALSGLTRDEIAEKSAAIAREAGFDLTTKDFVPASTELDESELKAVSGGDEPHYWFSIDGSGKDDPYCTVCYCSIEGWGGDPEGDTGPDGAYSLIYGGY